MVCKGNWGVERRILPGAAGAGAGAAREGRRRRELVRPALGRRRGAAPTWRTWLRRRGEDLLGFFAPRKRRRGSGEW